MADELEVDTDKSRETINEHRNQGRGEEGSGRPPWIDALAVSTALFAVIAAIVALLSNNYANEALLKANAGVLKQTRAVDKWNEYQADSLKKYEQQNLVKVLRHVNGSQEEIQAAEDEAAHRQALQDELQPQAQQLDDETNQLNKEAEEQLQHHHRFAVAVTLFQVAIGLGAVAALIRLRPVWWLSLCLGVLGLLSFVNGFTLTV